MSERMPERDERTVAVENAGYRWTYLFMSYGLLAAVAYRALVLKETSWDLLGLVVAGGVVATFYQGIHKVLSRRRAATALVTLLAAAIVGAAAAYVLGKG